MLLDLTPGHLWVVRDSVLSLVVEFDHVLQHAGSLVERTVLIVFRDTILLQIVILDDVCNFQSDLVRLSESRFTNQLNDFSQLEKDQRLGVRKVGKRLWSALSVTDG